MITGSRANAMGSLDLSVEKAYVPAQQSQPPSDKPPPQQQHFDPGSQPETPSQLPTLPSSILGRPPQSTPGSSKKKD